MRGRFLTIMARAEKILILGKDPFVNTLVSASINTHPDWRASLIECLRSIDKALDELSVREYEIILVDADSFSDSPLEILIRLKKVTKKTPIILLKQPGMEKTAIACLKNGADHYLVKDKNWEEEIPAMMDLVLEEQQRKKQFKGRIAQLEEENQRLKTSSILDDRTLFYSPQHFEVLLGRELKRAARYGLDLSCLILDIGAEGFEPLLESVALLIRSVARASDTWARIDETRFAAFLPHTSEAGTRQAIRRIQSEISGSQTVDLKWGVADYRKSKINNEQQFLKAAQLSLRESSLH